MESAEVGVRPWGVGRAALVTSLVVVMGVGGALAVMVSDRPDDVPTPVLVDDDERAFPEDPNEPDAESEGPVPADRTPLYGLAPAVAATLELTSWEVTLVQEMESFSAEVTSVVVGDTVAISQRLASVRTASLVVDGLAYSDDGSGWHLRPVPAASLVSLDLSQFIGGFEELPSSEIDRVDGIVRVDVECGGVDLAALSQAARQICPNEGQVTARIDEASGLLRSIRVEGSIEVYPGVFEEGFMEISIQSAVGRPGFEAPAEYSTERARCIADEVDLDLADTEALGAFLDTTSTEENRGLYEGCGFSTYPPGWDFRD